MMLVAVRGDDERKRGCASVRPARGTWTPALSAGRRAAPGAPPAGSAYGRGSARSAAVGGAEATSPDSAAASCSTARRSIPPSGAGAALTTVPQGCRRMRCCRCARRRDGVDRRVKREQPLLEAAEILHPGDDLLAGVAALLKSMPPSASRFAVCATKRSCVAEVMTGTPARIVSHCQTANGAAMRGREQARAGSRGFGGGDHAITGSRAGREWLPASSARRRTPGRGVRAARARRPRRDRRRRSGRCPRCVRSVTFERSTNIARRLLRRRRCRRGGAPKYRGPAPARGRNWRASGPWASCGSCAGSGRRRAR